MKIGLIADYLDFQLIGLGNYAYNLILNILKIDKRNDYVIIHTRENSIVTELVNKHNNLEEIIIPYSKLPGVRSTISLPRVLRKAEFDVVHDLSGYYPLFLLKINSKTLVTRHDMALFIFRKIYSDIQSRYLRLTLPTILRKVNHIIADSNSTKKDIIELLKLPREKISVIYLAPDDEYRVIKDFNILYTLKKKYNLPDDFILFVGDIDIRKNIINLVKAFYKLKKRGIIHKLVLTGRKTKSFGKILEIVTELKLKKDVIFTGYFPREHLPLLYNAADVFVQPSIYEGFTLTPLEAMACGTPVVTSNTDGFPEVIEDAGIMVDPYDVNGLSDALYNVLTNEGLRHILIKKGLKRVKKLSWKKTAKQTIEVYSKIVN